MVGTLDLTTGRVGRVLIAWMLTRRLALLVPPPVSVVIAADVSGYSSGLTRFRFGEYLPWVRWFADAVAAGATAQRTPIVRVEQIKQTWRGRLDATGRTTRSEATATAALERLPRHLVLTSRTVTDKLDISPRAALATLRRLDRAGILTEYGTVRTSASGHPAAPFVSQDLLGLAGARPLR